MTHDQLLQKVNINSLISPNALRAVIELHKPEMYKGKETGRCEAHDQCWGCGEWGQGEGCDCNAYPCSTIQAIIKEMN